MFQTKVVEKIKTHILCSVTFSPKKCRLLVNVIRNVVDTWYLSLCVGDKSKYRIDKVISPDDGHIVARNM